MCGRGAYTSAPGLRRRCTARRPAGRSSTPRSWRNMSAVEITPLSLLFLAMLAAAQPAERPNAVLLVAKPGLTDPNFRETVVLVTQTPDAQTIGVILNRPTERKLSAETVFFGGPVLRETIVALFQSREQPEPPAFHFLRDVYLTMQPDTVERLLARRGQRFRLYAGFSGWAPLQLQAELERDGWYVLPASVDLLFRKDTAGLWSELLAEARGEHAAEENPMRRCSVYFAYEASPPQPAAPRGVRARGAGIVSVAGRRDPARGAPRVPRPRVPADGADRRARAERGARRRHSQSSHQALARQPVPRARAVQESDGPGVLRRAVLARRAGGPGQGRQHAGRRRRAADEERVPRVPRQHHRSRHRDHPQRGALLRGLRRLASGRAEKRDRSRLVVGARRRRRSRLPQGHRRHVGGPPASHAPHPGQLSRWNSGRLTLFAYGVLSISRRRGHETRARRSLFNPWLGVLRERAVARAGPRQPGCRWVWRRHMGHRQNRGDQRHREAMGTRAVGRTGRGNALCQ